MYNARHKRAEETKSKDQDARNGEVNRELDSSQLHSNFAQVAPPRRLFPPDRCAALLSSLLWFPASAPACLSFAPFHLLCRLPPARRGHPLSRNLLGGFWVGLRAMPAWVRLRHNDLHPAVAPTGLNQALQSYRTSRGQPYHAYLPSRSRTALLNRDSSVSFW